MTDLAAQLVALDPSSEGFKTILLFLLSSPESVTTAAQSRGVEAQRLIDIIDQALDPRFTGANLSRSRLRTLREICGWTGLLPSSHMLSEGLQKRDNIAIASGSFADVWFGNYQIRHVAIKVLRIYHADHLAEVKKRLCREMIIWRRLSHPHLVPLLGVSESLFPYRLCMVSGWMVEGNITNYVNSHPEVDRLDLLKGVVNGLQYLHESDVVHGDLKGPNILVDNFGRACLADFGLTHILCDTRMVDSSITAFGSISSVRWMAPELLDPEAAGLSSARSSMASDIYALAMVICEVFTGKVPFSQLRFDPPVIIFVLGGSRPERPANTLHLGLSDEVWRIVQMCWQSDPDRRPIVSDVLDCWECTPAIVS